MGKQEKENFGLEWYLDLEKGKGGEKGKGEEEIFVLEWYSD